MWAGVAWGALGAAGLALSPCLVGVPVLGLAGARLVSWSGGRGGLGGATFVLLAYADLAAAALAAAGGLGALGAPNVVVGLAAWVSPAALAALGAVGGAAPWDPPPGAGRRGLAGALWWSPVWGLAVGLGRLPTVAVVTAAALATVAALPAGARTLAGAGSCRRGATVDPGARPPRLGGALRAASWTAGAVAVWALATPAPMTRGAPPGPDTPRGVALTVDLGEVDGLATVEDGRVVLRSPHGDLPGPVPLPGGARAERIALEPAAGTPSADGGVALLAESGGRWFRTTLAPSGHRTDDGAPRRLREALGVPGGLALLACLVAAGALGARRSRRDSRERAS